MNLELNIWDKLTRLVKFLLFVAGLLAVAIWYLPLIQYNERLRKRNMELDTQIQKKEELNRQMKNAVQALSHDPSAITRLAREQFGYGKPGETIIRFETPATNSTSRP